MDLKSVRPASQCGQDVFVDGYFGHKTGGVFVEAGAHDGETFSNTVYLERVRGWTGVCVEPHPETFKELQRNRKAKCFNVALGAENAQAVPFVLATGGVSGCSALKEFANIPRLDFFIGIHGGERTESTVPVMRTQDVLDLAGITEIDYFSLDTDGNELEVLRGIDWTRTTIRLMTVENTERCDKMRAEIEAHGFNFCGTLAWDDVYEKRQ